MSTTTIRLPDDLKARVAEATAQDERRAGFEAEAEGRYARIIASGETIPWADMRNYLKDKIAGKETALPKIYRSQNEAGYADREYR